MCYSGTCAALINETAYAKRWCACLRVDEYMVVVCDILHSYV